VRFINVFTYCLLTVVTENLFHSPVMLLWLIVLILCCQRFLYNAKNIKCYDITWWNFSRMGLEKVLESLWKILEFFLPKTAATLVMICCQFCYSGHSSFRSVVWLVALNSCPSYALTELVIAWCFLVNVDKRSVDAAYIFILTVCELYIVGEWHCPRYLISIDCLFVYANWLVLNRSM